MRKEGFCLTKRFNSQFHLNSKPTLFLDITEELDKLVILVLNKVDMVHPSVSVSWKRYFENKFPEIRVVLFSAFPDEQKLVENTGRRLLKKQNIKKPGWAYGAECLLHLAKSHYEKKKEMKEETPTNEKPHTFDDEESGSEDYITIGLIGQPNAGKSSLINGLLQDKKVSVSKTPGHTKHFQTIFYTPHIRYFRCSTEYINPFLGFERYSKKYVLSILRFYPSAILILALTIHVNRQSILK